MAVSLCIDTSSKNCSVAIFENSKLITVKEKKFDKPSHSEKVNVFIKRSFPFQFNERLSIKSTVSFLIKSTLYHSFHLVPAPLISIEFSFGNDVNHPIEAILNGEFNTASSKVSFLALLMSKKANKRSNLIINLIHPLFDLKILPSYQNSVFQY